MASRWKTAAHGVTEYPTFCYFPILHVRIHSSGRDEDGINGGGEPMSYESDKIIPPAYFDRVLVRA